MGRIPKGEAIGGVIDDGSIDEFMNGIFGVNKERNKKAGRAARNIAAAAIAYGVYRSIKKGRR